MSTQTILILYGSDDWNKEAPEYSDAQQYSYSVWGDICRKKSVQLARASIKWFEDGKFTKFWKYVGNTKWEKISEPLSPTVIYDKTKGYNSHTGKKDYSLLAQKDTINTYYRIKNPPTLTELVENKVNQAALFNSFVPYTTYIPHPTTIENSEENTWVIKKPYGSGGRHVWLTSDSHISLENSLLQTFVDLRKSGDNIKDVRCTFLGNDLQYVLSRTAQSDSVYTNLNQGADMTFLDQDSVPHIIEAAHTMLQPLIDVFPTPLISVDFLTNEDFSDYVLMEVNSKPALYVFYHASPELTTRSLNRLTDWLLTK